MSSTGSVSLIRVEAALCGRLEETLKALQKDRSGACSYRVWVSALHLVIADRTMAALPSHSQQRHRAVPGGVSLS